MFDLSWTGKIMIISKDHLEELHSWHLSFAMLLTLQLLSETRLPDFDSLKQERGTPYIWQALPMEAERIHVIGFAIKSSLMSRLPEFPAGVKQRIMTLHIPLTAYRYATLVSGYVPTLTNSGNVKKIPSLNNLTKLFNLFHPRRNSSCWGPHCQSGLAEWSLRWHYRSPWYWEKKQNGVRLQNVCVTQNITVTNTFFPLPDKHNTTWMHSRSKHWLLIYYIITKKYNLKDFIVTRAFRGADSWTDHRLICSKVNFQNRPPIRQQGNKNQIDHNVFHNQTKLSQLREAVQYLFEPAIWAWPTSHL